MKISARNQISGTIKSAAGRSSRRASPTRPIEDLALAVGDTVTVIVKSSDVLIGK